MKGGRGTTPLIGFGGAAVPTRPVSQAIQSSYISQVLNTTEQAYRMKAIKGLMLSGHDSRTLKNAADLRGKTLRQQLKEAQFDTGTEAGRKLALEQKRLQHRLAKDNLTQRAWQSTMRSVSTYLYGKGFKGASNFADRWSTDPLTALRGWAFDAYLGMFNYSQLLMQSMQAINVAAIGGGAGLKGVAMYAPVRFALSNGNPNVIRRTGELLSPVTGMDADDFVNMVEMMKKSNRQFVDNNVAELTTQADSTKIAGGSYVRRKIAAGREAGRVFFKEGDLMARISAFNTAYLEYTKKFGRITNPNDQRAMNWIAQRDQVLTQGMTTFNRQGYEQLPFMQFMTYQMRVNEALFAGTFDAKKAVLSVPEKLRLGFAHLALFGAGGYALTSFGMDRFNSHYDTELDETTYRLLRRGLIDTLLTQFTGVETAVGTRLGSGDGVFQFFRNFAENNVFGAVRGPSGDLLANLFNTTKNIATAVTRGSVEDTKARLGELARMTSTTNYVYNAITAAKYGRYLSKQGQLLDDDLDWTEAVFLAMGLPLEDVDTAYRYIAQQKIDRVFYRNHGRSISRTMNQINEAIRRSDFAAADEYSRILSIQWNSLSPYEQTKVERFVNVTPDSLTDRIYYDALLRDVAAQGELQ